MTRLLVLGLLIVVLWLAVKNFTLQFKMSVFGPPAGRRPAPPASRAASETLVRCGHCGVYVVPSRALKGEGEAAFCSEECRRRGAAQRPIPGC